MVLICLITELDRQVQTLHSQHIGHTSLGHRISVFTVQTMQYPGWVTPCGKFVFITMYEVYSYW